MVDVDARIIRKINNLLNCTDLPRFELIKRKSWAYEKEGATVYMFTDPQDSGGMLVAVFVGKNASLEYSIVENGIYKKTTFDFIRKGREYFVSKKMFSTEEKQERHK